MTIEHLQAYVNEHIPIVTANRFQLLDTGTEQVAVAGSLADHVNHRDSAFGGSLSTALILAAWARVRLWTETFEPHAVIVISRQTVEFTSPVLADFRAVTRPLASETLTRARAHLARFGKARFTVEADIVTDDGGPGLAHMAGEFVIVGQRG